MFDPLHSVYNPAPYFLVRVGGRELQVPNAADRQAQRLLYEAIKAHRAVSFKPELIQETIRNAFLSNPKIKALRTDIKSCFASIPQNVLKQEIDGLPLNPQLKANLIATFAPVAKGVPTGSPLSPWLADLVLQKVDSQMLEFTYFRYADDICVLGSDQECTRALDALRVTLGNLQMCLNEAKTKIVGQQDLIFLKRSYQVLEDKQLLCVNVGGDAFNLPNYKQVSVCVNQTGKPYSAPDGNPTYSKDCLLSRLLKEPNPYLLEVLMLKPACTDKDLAAIFSKPNDLLDSHVPHSLHGKIFRHYKNEVRDRLDAKGLDERVIGAAGEVYRWLYLTNHVMSTGKLPENYQPIEGEWLDLVGSMDQGIFEPYHKRIKQLFKEEYALRLGGKGIALPKEKPAIAASLNIE